MLAFRHITLEDRAPFKEMLRHMKYDNANYCFGNMFLWQKEWNIQICFDEDAIYLCGDGALGGHQGYYPPLAPDGADFAHAMDVLRQDAKDRGWRFLLKGAGDACLERMQAYCRDCFSVEDDRDNAEYVYNTTDLATLRGKRYHGKKNHVNAFVRSYAYASRELTPDDFEDCLAVFDRWAAGKREEDGIVDLAEREVVIQALTHMEALELHGVLLTVEDRPVAFQVGEQYAPDMALVHLEKADPDYNGAFAMINMLGAQYWDGKVALLNRAEDMGIEGMRKAKLSYKPVLLLPKYTLREKECACGESH